MADEEPTETTTEETVPSATAGAEQAPEPSFEEQLTLERERRIRLEGENRALRESKTEPSRPESRSELTVETIEAAFQSGQITDAQRIDLRADLVVRKRLQDAKTEDLKAQPLLTAKKRLTGYLTQYPALNDASSELIGKVTLHLQDLAELGYDPQDVRTQLLAVERVVGRPEGEPMEPREFTRRRIPTGGTGGGIGGGEGTKGGGGTPDPLKGIPATQINHWKRLGYSHEQMVAEAPFVKPRPHRGFV